jgi:ATP phosphoribosyltransferase regulatory subunit
MNSDRWLLPDGIEELLPQEARRLEALRRQLLDLFDSWGYELVIPPFVEYVESLLTSVGSDLNVQTYKIIDQHNGRLMGVRADMTPQVARIDAHRLRRDEPTRLCYLGTVLRTKSDEFASSRSLIQLGAELYGHAGIESDFEMLCLMLETLLSTGLKDVYLDIGHVGVFQGLSDQAGLDANQRAYLFEALQRKAVPEIHEFLSPLNIDVDLREMLQELAMLNGGEEILNEARERLKNAGASVQASLDQLDRLAAWIAARYPKLPLHFDLAEVRGIQYHTGVVFAAYQPGVGQSIAQGGRYDDIGKVFGRARPATGFSADLRTIMKLSEDTFAPKNAIFAPAVDDSALTAKIAQLRANGERVIVELPGQSAAPEQMRCDRKLVSQSGDWRVVELK